MSIQAKSICALALALLVNVAVALTAHFVATAVVHWALVVILGVGLAVQIRNMRWAERTSTALQEMSETMDRLLLCTDDNDRARLREELQAKITAHKALIEERDRGWLR